MDQPTDLQRLLMYVRDTYCRGSAAELSRKIEKADTYVNRLFYPPDKRGHKGIGLEIMKACTKAFNLPAGFWEAPIPAKTSDQNVRIINRIKESPYGQFAPWPFLTLWPEDYEQLSDKLKAETEEFILFKLALQNKDPPAEQITPANNERTGTNL